MILLAMMLAAATPAKLILPGRPATVVNYPSMRRCLAAKAAIERQSEQQRRADLARGFIRAGTPTVYCVPA